MKPEERSRKLLAITRSKAKMYEYDLPEQEHITITRDPARLLRLAIGMVGDFAAAVARNNSVTTTQNVERSSGLRFAARYFDAYSASKLALSHDAYLLLLASVAYYGSSGKLVG